ncbi:glucose 1-dehydrogenase [Sneathiella sp.]|jgi:3(or 17)beta-hydroxysteroid dehydrogenase|uniref:glucose 1-dehydrogenase n=1 Tax=Sneathiella sp. TaxID=1964365 RepID=UPI0039E5496B
MGRLNQKVALITGGAGGIGLATAKLFQAEGAKVVVTDKNAEAGKTALNALEAGAIFLQHDVTLPDAWKSVFEQTSEQFGQIDILVNNAGLLKTAPTQTLMTTDLAHWKAVNSVNVEGVFLGCQAAVKHMKEKGGVIVNIASVAANQSTPSLIAYGASKAAVAHLTKSVASHCLYQGYPIRCNSVHPNPIKTAMGDELMSQMGGGDPVAGWREFEKVKGYGGAGEPDDVARSILFLSSDEARHTNGAELMVDGGMAIRVS